MPYNIVELLSEYTDEDEIYIGAMILSLIFIKPATRSMYFLVCFYSYFIYSICINTTNTILSLKNENYVLKDKTEKLSKKMNRMQEYDMQMVYMSKMEERNKLSQSMHDSAGHAIAGSLMQLEVSKLLIDKDKEKAIGIIDNVIQVLRKGLDELRLTLRAAKPEKEELGVNRIKLLLDELKINGIDTYFSAEGKMDLITFIQWKVIYENTNEALTNITKYSNAKKVETQITVLNKLIRVVIKDNGVGADFVTKGLGIIGMEERTEGIGGKLITDGSDGFSVIMLLPLEK